MRYWHIVPPAILHASENSRRGLPVGRGSNSSISDR